MELIDEREQIPIGEVMSAFLHHKGFYDLHFFFFRDKGGDISRKHSNCLIHLLGGVLQGA